MPFRGLKSLLVDEYKNVLFAPKIILADKFGEHQIQEIWKSCFSLLNI